MNRTGQPEAGNPAGLLFDGRGIEMTKKEKAKKLLKDAYTVDRDGRRYRIKPVFGEYAAADLQYIYQNGTPENPVTLEDGTTAYYDGEWFIIRDYGDGRKPTIAILTAG